MDTEGPAVRTQSGLGVSTLHSDQSCPGTPVRLGSRTDTGPAGDQAWEERGEGAMSPF